MRVSLVARGRYRSLALVAIGAPALAESPAGDWRQTVFLCGMGAAIDGDAQIGPLQVPVDVGLSDFFDSLKFGAMAAYRVESEEWSFTGASRRISRSRRRSRISTSRRTCGSHCCSRFALRAVSPAGSTRWSGSITGTTS